MLSPDSSRLSGGGSALEVAQKDMGSCRSPCPALSPALLIYEMSAGFLGSEWARMQVSGIFGAVACPSLQVSLFQEREQT